MIFKCNGCPEARYDCVPFIPHKNAFITMYGINHNLQDWKKNAFNIFRIQAARDLRRVDDIGTQNRRDLAFAVSWGSGNPLRQVIRDIWLHLIRLYASDRLAAFAAVLWLSCQKHPTLGAPLT